MNTAVFCIMLSNSITVCSVQGEAHTDKTDMTIYGKRDPDPIENTVLIAEETEL